MRDQFVIEEEDIDEKEVMIIPEEPEVKQNVISMLKQKKEIKKIKSKQTKKSKSPTLQKNSSRVKSSWKSPLHEINQNQKSSKQQKSIE